MAPNPLFYDEIVIASVAAAAAKLNSGTVQVLTGAQPALNGALTGTLLAKGTFGNPAFGTPTAAAGTITAAAETITGENIENSGTAGYMALVKSDGATVVATGSVGTSSADMTVNTTAFVAGAAFAVTSGALTQGQT